MAEIVEFQLESGEVVFMEASGAGSTRAGRAGGASRMAGKASKTFEAALEKVKPAARAVVDAFRELNEPDEIGLEFGIAFKTELDAFVLTGEASASFKLSLKWKNEKA